MNHKVDIYLEEGCGRCSLYRTPECKVHTWQEELKLLRKIVLDCGLQEEYKWSQPCYTYKNGNILLVTAFKEYATIAFFKGSLLKDSHDILTAPGENSQAVRQARFTNVKDIIKIEPILKSYIYEALEVEKSGLKVTFKKNPEPLPEELEGKFSELPEFKSAFEALTPGRKRGYILHFSQPKQSKTRESRIEKNIERILNGKGFHDR
ncbi:uncharacterized protein YdeI (YjbR/CyaY-like superfamily) [Saonia flava]|uniref:Uncharacterized protein YdeI (YjbR/CyaY-like superfamily) n=1 Tax=Saonia flava TaxID=523696 RepID=A0A846QYH5_9FLAO|nr:DUF1801 domain-containing protein [Saonia flava]NJB72257.1 uncharacterized protein YdeI (YjbR/CyaY-like superfamily) [Saonia flava]